MPQKRADAVNAASIVPSAHSEVAMARQWLPAKLAGDVLVMAERNVYIDLGVFKILPDSYQMVFSQQLNGSEASTGTMPAYHGAGLILPQSDDYLPNREYLDWHSTQVFKSPARTG